MRRKKERARRRIGKEKGKDVGQGRRKSEKENRKSKKEREMREGRGKKRKEQRKWLLTDYAIKST